MAKVSALLFFNHNDNEKTMTTKDFYALPLVERMTGEERGRIADIYIRNRRNADETNNKLSRTVSLTKVRVLGEVFGSAFFKNLKTDEEEGQL